MSKSIADPQNVRSRRTRNALLAAARAILEEAGFEALTMGAVAERAGVSRRGAYLHYASRTDLVVALFEYVAQQEGLADSIRPVFEAPDSVAALTEWARHLARYHPRMMTIDRAIQRVERVDPDAARHRRTVTEAQLTGCRRLAGWLEQEGRLAPGWTVDSATDMLWALIATDMIERLLAGRGWTPERLGEHLAVMFRATFTTEG